MIGFIVLMFSVNRRYQVAETRITSSENQRFPTMGYEICGDSGAFSDSHRVGATDPAGTTCGL